MNRSCFHWKDWKKTPLYGLLNAVLVNFEKFIFSLKSFFKLLRTTYKPLKNWFSKLDYQKYWFLNQGSRFKLQVETACQLYLRQVLTALSSAPLLITVTIHLNNLIIIVMVIIVIIIKMINNNNKSSHCTTN